MSDEIIDMELQDEVIVGGASDELWLPNVNEDGDISWQRSKSKVAPETRNIKGPAGSDGQDGADGLGIKSVDIDGSNHLIVTYDDDTTHDAGAIPGGSGSASWGGITGTLSDQTDLNTALNAKANTDDILSNVAVTNYNVLKVSDGSGSKNGVSWSKADGVITLDGTSSAATDFNLGDNSTDGILPDGTYKISMEIISGSYSGTLAYNNNVSYIALSATTPASATLSNGTRSRLNWANGVVFNNLKIHVWANSGSTAHEYQKYGETSASKLKDDIIIERLDEHLEDSTIHVTAAEKAKIDALPDVVTGFDAEIAKTAQDALGDVNGKSLMLCVMADNHVCPTPYMSSGVEIGAESERQYHTQLAHVKALSLPIDAMVHFGDLVNTQWWWYTVKNGTLTTDEEYQSLVSQYANGLRESGIENIFIAGGNHDGGLNIVSGTPSTGNEYSSYNAAYRNVGKASDIYNTVRKSRLPYYYVDFDQYKLRLIFLYTNIDSDNSEVKGLDAAQVVWLKESLQTVPDGYNVMLFGHISFSMFATALSTSAYSKYTDAVGIITAFQNATSYTGSSADLSADFTGNTSKILAYLCGHYHGDRIVLPSDEHSVMPIPEIMIASAGYVTDGVIDSGDYYDVNDAPSRTVRTITEDLFDVLVYSPQSMKLSFRRFGAGVDREVDLSGILTGVTTSDDASAKYLTQKDIKALIDDTTAANNKVYSSAKVESLISGSPSPSYRGKKVVHMGDSWVELYNIAELAAQKVGYTLINVGMQATAITNVYKAPPTGSNVANADKLSLISLAQAIQTNTWTEQDSAASGKSWAGQLAKLKAIDWSTIDVLVLSYGVNDYNYQSTPGDIEARDSESVCGALKTAIGILGNLNANMEIVLTTPCLCYRSPDSETMKNFKPRVLLDEYRIAIGLTAKEYGIKLVDMRAISGINQSNYSDTLLSDGLHPTVLGQQLWANAFAKSLEGGYAGAFDTNVFGIKEDANNLCEDSEKYSYHKKWNASYVSAGVKYLCTRATKQYENMILGQAFFASLPTGSVLKIEGIGKKIGDTNHRADIYVYDSTKENKLLEKTSSVINNTTEAPFEYSWTTTADYTNCWVIFVIKQMSKWENGKALVRDVKCTVTLPST